MIPILAKESIILKSRRDHNTILGNYECAYALGLISQLSGLPLMADHTDMKALHADFMEKIKQYQTEDVQQKRIIHILSLYKPDDLVDSQTEELLQWGLKEDGPWEI